MILSPQTIKALGILTPCPDQGRHEGTTFGLGPAGYDLRLVLPNDLSEYPMRPGEFLLVAAAERFHMPQDVVGIVHDKSTWARRGLAVQNTVIEPSWRGYLTLELTNHSQDTLVLHSGQGIAQVVFHRMDQRTNRPYNGKYQDQEWGPQEARG